MRYFSGGLTSLLVLLCSGCSGGSSSGAVHDAFGERPNPAGAFALAAERPSNCGSLEKLSNASTPMRRESSSVALRRDGERLFAYVADPEALTIDVIDVHARRFLSSTPTSGSVEQLLMLPSGHLAATIQDGSHLEIFRPSEAGALAIACSRDVPPGSFGMALSPDDATLAVTGRTAGTVTLLAADDLLARRIVGVPRAPAGLVFEAGALYVSHLVGAHVSVIDLASFEVKTVSTELTVAADDSEDATSSSGLFGGAPPAPKKAPRTASQAYALVSVALDSPRAASAAEPSSRAVSAPKPVTPARAPRFAAAPTTRIVVPMISVDPGGPSRPTHNYYGPPEELGVPKQAHVGFLIDPTSRAGLSRHIVADRAQYARGPCYAPRGAAYDPATESMFVTCFGTDTLLELDARSADPMRAVRKSHRTPRGPTGVAVASEERVAVVMGSFEGSVSIIDLTEGTSTVVDIDVPLSAFAEEHLAGKQLFHRADDRSLSFDGLACANCHVEGGEDGVSWMTPTGPRQTLMLAGRLAHSAPFGWDRNAETLGEYVGGTVDRLGGNGLAEGQREKLVAYIASMPAPPIDVVEASRVIEGQALFEANGCSDCHAGGATNGKPYDVGDRRPFDTPSLQRVSLSAPYYHDGRYASLGQLLRDKSNGMGRTAELDERAIEAIEHYLRSL